MNSKCLGWNWNSNTLATSCKELIHWKRPWCWEGLGAGGEGDDRGWDGWMASLTRWTWVWVNSGSCWSTGRPGLLQFMGSQRVRHNWTTELNWTEDEIDNQCIVVVVQSLTCGQLFATPWTAACQASLSFIISQSLPKFMSINDAIQPSHSLPPSSCLQSFLASESFPMSWLFTSGSQNIEASISVLASVFLVCIWVDFP